MNKVKYMGFCGKAGSGKTTACNILQNIHKMDSGIFSWAFELKRIAREEFGWDGKKDEKGRKLLQTLGTECGRMYGGELFWVDRWQSNVDKFTNRQDLCNNFLILNDDTRFDSEAKRIKDNGGIMIEIYGRQINLGDNSAHSSETGINSKYIDFKIDNSGTMSELEDELLRRYNDLQW